MKKVAIFDIDGTIFRSSLLIEIVEALIEHGFFPAGARKEYQEPYRQWLDRKDSYEKYIGAVVAVFEKHLHKVHRRDFSKIAKKVVAAQKDHVYRYTRDLAQELKKKQYYILAISHSPKDILNEFCRNLGFDKVYGRVY
ncbi:MAG: HAD family hydrolase, partial [Candidatus Saccharimonadales bacterium]